MDEELGAALVEEGAGEPLDVLAALLAAQSGGEPAAGPLALPVGCERATVLASLHAAVRALQEQRRQHERRRQLPANVGKPWTAEQDAALLAAFDAGVPLDALAAQFARTRTGIRTRLERHGRLTPVVPVARGGAESRA